MGHSVKRTSSGMRQSPLCSSGWLETHLVDYTGLELIETHLVVSPRCIRGVCHHILPTAKFKMAMLVTDKRRSFRIRQALLGIIALPVLIVCLENVPAVSEHQLLHWPKQEKNV